MSKAFRRGVLAGILAPAAFVAGTVYWVYRFTRKVPFPVRRIQEGELAVRLVDPTEVPTYWQQWRAELEPLLSRLRLIADGVAQNLRLPE